MKKGARRFFNQTDPRTKKGLAPFLAFFLIFLISGAYPAHAQLARRVDKDSSAYEALVRKNLELRKELQDFERKYADLENERKVLILHVRDLQAARDARAADIQDLKGKIAALRVEMLKDPKMVKTLDALNRRIQETADEKDQLQKRVNILGEEKEKLFNELRVIRDLYNKEKEVSRQKKDEGTDTDKMAEEQAKKLAEELEQARSAFRKKEESLIEDLKAIRDEKAGMEKKNQELEEELEETMALFQKEETASKKRTDEAADGETKEIEEIRAQAKKAGQELRDELSFVQAKRDVLGERNKSLEEEIKDLKALLKRAKAPKDGKIEIQKKGDQGPEPGIARLEKRNAALEKEIREAELLLAGREENFKKQLSRLEDENARLKADSGKEEEDAGERIKRMNKEIARLEVDLKNAEKGKKENSKKVPELEKQIEEIEAENRKLVLECKDVGALLQKAEKALEDQTREVRYDKEYLGQKVKNAQADKLMLEARVKGLEESAASAEAKADGFKKETERIAAVASLQESEIMVLREEKSKLEQKLIRYIEKIIEKEDVRRKDIKPEKRETLGYEEVTRDQKAKTNRALDQQKLDMHYNLAIAYDRRGMFMEEEKEYLNCLKVNPNDANVHYNLAILYDDKLNNNKNAIRHYQRFIELRPIGEDALQVKDWMLRAEQEDRLGPQMR